MTTLRVYQGLVVVLVAISFTAPGLAQSASSSQRSMIPDDLLKFESIDMVDLAPDGKSLAYVIKRSKASQPFYTYKDTLFGTARHDIWVSSTEAPNPQNITNGIIDGDGYSYPRWSPDGQRIVMLSTKGGKLRPWIWEKSSGQLSLLTDRPVRARFDFASWISNTEILCYVLPAGFEPQAASSDKLLGAQMATQSWTEAWTGKEVTSSVLESGQPAAPETRPFGELRIINAISGTHKVIAVGDIAFPLVSPNKKLVAFYKFVSDSNLGRDSTPSVDLQWRGYKLVITTMNGDPIINGVDQIKFLNPLVDAARWSSDSTMLAQVGRADFDSDLSKKVFEIHVADSAVRSFTENDLNPLDLIWTRKNQLLVRATSNLVSRADWFLFGSGKKPLNLTEIFQTAPSSLFLHDTDSVIGVADSDLWLIDLNTRKPVNLTAGLAPRVTSIVRTVSDFRSTDLGEEIVLFTQNGDNREIFQINLRKQTVTQVKKPTPDASLATFDTRKQTFVFKTEDAAGCRLLVLDRRTLGFNKLAEINTFVREIAQPELRRIEYSGLDGQKLIGWLMLPLNYSASSRYPLVVIVYAGTVWGERPTTQQTIGSHISDYPMSMHLFVAHGYAVLWPSMPLRPQSEPSDVYFELTKGVLPAIDKVIDDGFVDPKRIGVMGSSFGGYSTYGLITQTTRFKAAVAMAGLTDLISYYGTIEAGNRYSDKYQISSAIKRSEKDGQQRLGSPFWRDYERYRRNSPISYVERVQTPLMMIHGDMDAVPIQQAEEFFTALERQGKRARFVRYWGEGHVIESPANILDIWKQIYAWFDEFLKKPEKTESSKQ